LPKPTDHVFPGNHIKMFHALLDRGELKLDRDGNRRIAYSLRHIYICMRLMGGADIDQIAKNCRTSMEMIKNTESSYCAFTNYLARAYHAALLETRPTLRAKQNS
jgi:hypothetical protein